MKRIFLILAISTLSLPCFGQAWSGILTATRAIDWTKAGLPASITYGTGGSACTGSIANCVETITNPWTPPTRAKSGSTITCANTAGDVTTLNNALAAASPGSFVLFTSTCSIPTNLTLITGVTLRGSGPMSSSLNVSGSSTQIAFGTCCGGVNSGPLSASSYASGTNSVTITGPTCTTTCTSNGLVTGNVTWIQQCDTGWTGTGTQTNPPFSFADTTVPSCTSGSYSDPGTFWVCGIDWGVCADNNTNADVNHYYERQIVTITGVVNNGGGSYTVTFTPGLYAANWSSSNNARMFWIPLSSFTQGAGVEDTTVNFTFNTTEQFAPASAYAGWIKGNRILGATANPNISIGGNHFLISNDLDFAQNFNNLAAPNQESMIRASGSDNLIINNIILGTQAIWGNGKNFGDVIAYNLCRDAQTAYYANESVDHNPFGAYVLHEGNQCGLIDDDDTHGTHDLNTDFRNYLSGWDPPYLTVNSQAREIGNYHRFINVIGNAIGGTQSTAYQGTSSSVGNEFVIATGDALAGASLMRWGNCDVINAGCRFLAAEVPNTTNMPAGTYPNATAYQNATPGNNNLPCSFYITGSAFTTSPCAIKTSGGTGLSWWKVCTNYPTCNSFSTPQYPPIGPDQSGGPYVNGHAYDIPAAVAYTNLPIDTALQSSFTITGSSWSGGTETLTVSLASINNGSANHIMGGFQLSGVNAACVPSGLPTNNEILMTGSSTTTVQYALPNPGVTCTGTLKFPTIRQFDESIFQSDPAQITTYSNVNGMVLRGVTSN